MISFFTTTLMILMVSPAANADDEIFKTVSEPPTQLEVVAERISLRNDIYDKEFLTGPLKDLAWNERFNMRNTSLGASLIDTPNFEMGMQGGLRMGRFDSSEEEESSVDDPFDDGLELGVFTQGRYGEYLVGTRLSKDVASGREGTVGEFMAGYEKKLSDKFDLSFGLGTTWTDEKYLSSSHGSDASQSKAIGSSNDNARAGFKNASLTVTACYQLSDYWSLGAQVGYMRLLGETAEDPANEDGEQENFVTGFQLQYRLRGLTSNNFQNLVQTACSSY
ncbi:MAG: MipA/OmpV family protein [Gammaproteobacteria bacterium]|nr:MipA/OmpV family protein [Gammaproteobacteria bacterium]